MESYAVQKLENGLKHNGVVQNQAYSAIEGYPGTPDECTAFVKAQHAGSESPHYDKNNKFLR